MDHRSVSAWSPSDSKIKRFAAARHAKHTFLVIARMMFTCVSGEDDVSIESTWKSEQRDQSVDTSCQTRSLSYATEATQTEAKRDLAVQTYFERKKTNPDEETLENVALFLDRVTPFVERALKRNNDCRYRDPRAVVENETASLKSEDVELKHEFIYPFTNDLTKDKKIQTTGVSWNTSGSTLCVAYGRHDHQSWCSCARNGVKPAFCAWNVFRRDVDPRKPHLTFQTQSCLTCIACHPHNPALVAAGTFNGEILVWDTSSKEDPLIAQSRIDDYFHREPIADMKWVRTYDDRGHISYDLATTGGDGKILMWTLRNNLVAPVRGLRLGPSSSLTSDNRFESKRSSFVYGGASLAFVGGTNQQLSSAVVASSSSFVVGTEGGRVLRCFLSQGDARAADALSSSKSTWTRSAIQTMSYLSSDAMTSVREHVETYAKRNRTQEIDEDTIFASRPPLGDMYPVAPGFPFKAHVGPVYALDTSPFERNAFLSSGVDGEIRMYSMLQSQPVRTIDAGASYVFDVAFSPHRPTVFAAATKRGGIHIYDLLRDPCNPVVRKRRDGDDVPSQDLTSQVCVRFNPSQRGFLASGDSRGRVCVWKLPWCLTESRHGEVDRLRELIGDKEGTSSGAE